MSILISHATGNRNVRSVIAALDKAGMLSQFNTTLAANPEHFWLTLLPSGIRQECLRRSFPVDFNRIKFFPWLELARMILPKLGYNSCVQHECGWASVDAVYRNLDNHTSAGLSQVIEKFAIKAVYAYEDGALETFQKAKDLGLKCVYDLPIAYWETGRRLMQAEAERLPNWAITLGGGISDSDEKLLRKTKELELADMVVTPGEFVTRSLPDWSRNKHIHMAAFGTPSGSKVVSKMQDPNQPLRILFVGSMGQRKGLGDLFAAMKLLNNRNIELVVMGSLQASMEFYKNEFPLFTYEAGRPHEQVLALMRSCDVFCLPSIVEGRALVMQEAMSQGLPLIITPNTGGEDLIIKNKTGFLVPIDSPEAIAQKINWFYENRTMVNEMGREAQIHASKYTWDAYGDSIAEELKSLLT
jgi:glycosyltransferase involved in cell wall biosynthesis